MDERNAIRCLKRGDIAGLETLVNRYQMKAVRTAYLITQDAALAEDIMQSAFLRAYDRIHQFKDGYPFEPWFMKIVVNMALKAAGGQGKLIDLNENIKLHDTPLEQLVELGEMETVIRETLESLSPEQRAVIVLRYYLGYTETEMMNKLNSPLGTIRWRLFPPVNGSNPC